MENQNWMCSICRENDKTDFNHSSETKVLERYVDDFVKTVRGDTKELLVAVYINLIWKMRNPVIFMTSVGLKKQRNI